MRRLLLIVAGVACIVFVWWHWKLGMIRYFDVDEFAYLHWAQQVSVGQRPYLDFFFYIPPGFLWLLAPLFWLGNGLWPIFAARILAGGIFAALCVAVGVLFYLLRGGKKDHWMLLLPGALLAFLPLPFDKFLEIRPDTLSMLLVVVGMIFQLRSRWGWAGVWYALSLIILPKSLPIVAVAGAIVLLSSRKGAWALLGGAVLPLGLMGAWLLLLGQTDTVVYSLIRLPFETSQIAKVFIMQPDLFFYPNPTFYGTTGWSRELMVNHAVWLLAMVMGIYRFLTKRDEWLVSGACIVSLLSFVYLYPLRHAQYLIPLAVFVAFYGADLLAAVWRRLKRLRMGEEAFILVLVLLFVFLFDVFRAVNTPKISWTNTQMLADMQSLWEIIPPNAYVLDLDGRTLYFRDPHYACCLPLGQYEPYLSHPLTPLWEALEEKDVQYIYEGQLARIGTLSAKDQAYIQANFRIDTRVPGLRIRR